MKGPKKTPTVSLMEDRSSGLQPEFTFCSWERHTWSAGKSRKRVVHTERKEERKKERHQESRGQGKGEEQDRRWVVARGGGRENFLGLPLRTLAGNQADRRQVVRADNGAEECGTWD